MVQGIIKKHEIENKEISGPNEINNEKLNCKNFVKSLPQINIMLLLKKPLIP